VYLLYSGYILVKGSEVIGIREIILDAALIFAVSAALLLAKIKNLKPLMIILMLSLIQLADLSENIHHSFYYFEFADMGSYQRYVKRLGAVIDNIKTQDDSFYRIEKTFKRSHNDSMQFDYAGMTHYSSCEKKEVISYMKKLGFRDNGNWSFYDNGSTALVDSIFGIKYLISQYDYTGKKYKRFDKVKYEDEFGKDKYFTYMNQYALPLMYVATDKITEVEPGDDNTFEFQNRIADAINGESNNFFTKAKVSQYNLYNLTEEEVDGVHTYKKIDENEKAYIEYVVNITEEYEGLLLEGYFDAPDYQEATIEINDDDKGEYFSKYHWSVVDMAKHDLGEVIHIKIHLNNNTLQLTDTYLYFEDMFHLKDWVAQVQENECTLNKITSSHLKGEAKLSEDGQIVFSFPYEDSWEVYMDGEKVETEKAAGLLLSVKASAGSHDLELKYKQAGRIPGVIIFVIGLIAMFMITYVDHKNIRKTEITDYK